MPPENGQIISASAPAPLPRGKSALLRWLPLGMGVLAFLIVLVAGLAVTVEWGARNAEMRRLVTAVESSEAAMTTTQVTVAEALDVFDASDGGESAKMELDSKLTAAADEGRRQIEAAGSSVADVEVLPWHTNIADARDAYLAHNLAWQDYLARATDDPAEFDKEQADVNSTFELVEPLMRRALPNPALFDLDQRIDVVFVPAPAAPGDLQSA